MNDTAPTPIRRTYQRAALLAMRGFRVFPLSPRTKIPPKGFAWSDEATNDAGKIDEWFETGENNLALACGPQPNGMNILVVDVDPGHGGDVTWRNLLNQHGDLPVHPMHATRQDGWHHFFLAPEGFRNTRNRLGEGIDTRADGGYVVLPPSMVKRDDSDEMGSYRATKAMSLWSDPLVIPPAPEWMLELLAPPVREAVPAARPSTSTAHSSQSTPDETPFDYIRRTEAWETHLERQGWTRGKDSGEDQCWTRPGKSVRDGKSALLHPSGALVIWTTEIPRELENLGTPTPDGTGVSISLPDFICAYEFGGDRTLFSRSVRERMPRSAPSPQASPPPGSDAVPGPTPTVGLNLPEEFWARRPVLAQIQQAARSRYVSPDALLCNVLARLAAIVPPQYRLPALIGKQGTFDFLGAVVATTSGGKSAANGVAEALVVNRNEMVHMDYPVGSGEGLVQSFFVPELDDETGKKTGKQRVGVQGIHFVVDEGMALVGMASRSGSTIIPTMCSAWSGSVLGNTNADPERRRIIPAGKVRVASVMNMQTGNGWMLFEEPLASMGFPARTLFAWALDPGHNGEAPEWPGPLSFPALPVYTGGTVELTYPPAVRQEVLSGRLAVLRGETVDTSLSGHNVLLRCKLAGLLALQEDRLAVSEDDWDLAGVIVAQSVRVLEHLGSVKRARDAEEGHRRAVSRGMAEATVEDVKEAQRRLVLTSRVQARLKQSDATWRQIKDMVNAGDRHLLRSVVDDMIASGAVKQDGGTLRWI